MPTIPVYERRQGLAGGSTASFANASALTAPGRALQGVGDAISSAGSQIEARAERTQNSIDDAWFSRARAQTAVQMQEHQRALQQGATGDASGITEEASQTYQQIRQRHLDEAPSPRAQEMFDAWSFQFGARVESDALNFQSESLLAQRTDDFNEAMNNHLKVVATDPAAFDDVMARVNDDLVAAQQWMTPEQETEARNRVEAALVTARERGIIDANPFAWQEQTTVQSDTPSAEFNFSPEVSSAISSAAQRHGVSENALNTIAFIESSGNPSAKNPNSTASGLFQVIRGTARQYGLSNPFDPNANADTAARIMSEAIVGLRRVLGREPNTGELYLAHQQGLGGATELLANPDKPAVQIVGREAVMLNGGRGDMTAQEFANIWINKANRIAGEGGDAAPSTPRPDYTNPRFAGLSVDDIDKLFQHSQRQQTAQLASLKGSMELGITLGDPSVTRESVLQSPLPDAQKEDLISAINTRDRASDGAAQFANRLGDGPDAFNRFDSDTQKAADRFFRDTTNSESIFGENRQPLGVGLAIYEQSRILPSSMRDEMRAGLESSDPARLAAAASVAARLEAIDGGALEAVTGGADIRKAAAMYRQLTGRGLTHDEVGERLADLNDPEKARQRQLLLETEPVKNARKEIDEDYISTRFETLAPFDEPQTGETPEQAAVMVQEYRDIFDEAVIEAAGDLDIAEELALQRFSRFYGVTDMALSGTGILTRLPPEVTYPAGPDGSHDYVREQAANDLEAAGFKIPAENIFFQTYEGTESDVRSGELPRYLVYFQDDNGNIQLHQNPFVMGAEDLTARLDEARRERISGARERNLQSRLFGFNDADTASDPVVTPELTPPAQSPTFGIEPESP